MVSIDESEQLGNCINILEVLNCLILEKGGKVVSRVWINKKIKKVIELMDGVLC